MESISSGLADGGWLPPEGELTAALGVSRATLREALKILEIEGVITRRRGKGTRVNSHLAQHGVQANAVIGWYDMIRQAGFKPHFKHTTVSQGFAPADVARRLQVVGGSPVLVIERLLLADDVPAVLLVEHILHESLLGPVEAVPDTIFEFSETHCVVPADHSILEVHTTVCDTDLADVLGLPRGAPVLKLMETVYSADGAPFIATPTYVVDHVLALTVVRRRM